MRDLACSPQLAAVMTNEIRYRACGRSLRRFLICWTDAIGKWLFASDKFEIVSAKLAAKHLHIWTSVIVVFSTSVLIWVVEWPAELKSRTFTANLVRESVIVLSIVHLGASCVCIRWPNAASLTASACTIVDMFIIGYHHPGTEVSETQLTRQEAEDLLDRFYVEVTVVHCCAIFTMIFSAMYVMFRRHAMVALFLGPIASYTKLSLEAGVCRGFGEATVIMGFSMFIVLTKFKLEQAQRTNFCSLEGKDRLIVAEKVLRCQAEFASDMLKRQTGRRSGLKVKKLPSCEISRKSAPTRLWSINKQPSVVKSECLPPKSQVWVEGQPLPKAIQEVTSNDAILCFDSVARTPQYIQVLETKFIEGDTKWVRVHLVDDTVLTLTANHPVLPEAPNQKPGDCICAGDLMPERDKLLVMKLVPVPVKYVDACAPPLQSDDGRRVAISVRNPRRYEIFVASEGRQQSALAVCASNSPAMKRSRSVDMMPVKNTFLHFNESAHASRVQRSHSDPSPRRPTAILRTIASASSLLPAEPTTSTGQGWGTSGGSWTTGSASLSNGFRVPGPHPGRTVRSHSFNPGVPSASAAAQVNNANGIIVRGVGADLEHSRSTRTLSTESQYTFWTSNARGPTDALPSVAPAYWTQEPANSPTAHEQGICRPCVFHFKSQTGRYPDCFKGASCDRCHEMHQELPKRSRPSGAARRQIARLRREMVGSGSVSGSSQDPGHCLSI